MIVTGHQVIRRTSTRQEIRVTYHTVKIQILSKTSEAKLPGMLRIKESSLDESEQRACPARKRKNLALQTIHVKGILWKESAILDN
jgi:hypothetical protein